MQTDDGEIWHKTWAFPVDVNRAGREGYGKQNCEGYFINDDSFPGCPCCGAKQVIFCGYCSRASCWNGETEMDCAWCGKRIEGIHITEEKLNYQAGADL